MGLKIRLLSTAFVASLALTGCSVTDKGQSPGDAFQGQSAQQIFDAGEVSLKKGHYKDAIKHFEGLEALYPFSSYEEQSQIDSIYAYYESGDYDSAAAAADRFIRLYPRSEHIDYVYYMKGMSHYQVNRGFASKYVNLDLAKRDLSSANQAFDDFAQLVQLYPDSPYAASAKLRMIALRNLMAQHELEVGEYYYRRGSYLAAANRGDYVVEHYQQAPAIVPALGLMVRSYRLLGLSDMANRALSILQYNYPNSSDYLTLKDAKTPQKS
jgi:outer membrane protein assembly factor BamD